ncbi:TetR/AcrR family transcriptional regulator [Candidatus Methanomassiliicoccus intestinalis]|uniref:TetR/AcrR family transcriptional regulator n=1 Tax=Candidatus Methanomassiliicoccus intestinalis TaxID=1406512 RepID=UPI0037DCA485
MKTARKTAKPLPSPANQKRDDARHKILEVAMELFYVQGYDKTTTRQIIQKAGILNGSLYHSFTNKEEIFKTIIVSAFRNALEESEKLFPKTETIQDLITVATFPIALELYAASKFKRAAELLYQAHQSWTVLDGFIKVSIDWVAQHSTLFNPTENKRGFYANTLAIMGAIGNLVGEFANTDDEIDYRASFRIGLEVFCTVFKYPIYALDEMVEKICNILETNDIQIFEHMIKSDTQKQLMIDLA